MHNAWVCEAQKDHSLHQCTLHTKKAANPRGLALYLLITCICTTPGSFARPKSRAMVNNKKKINKILRI